MKEPTAAVGPSSFLSFLVSVVVWLAVVITASPVEPRAAVAITSASSVVDPFFNVHQLFFGLSIQTPNCRNSRAAHYAYFLPMISSNSMFLSRPLPLPRATAVGSYAQCYREISDAEFEAFVDQEVLPRLPLGFTVIDGQGFYSSQAGLPVKEKSKVLVFIAPTTSESAPEPLSDGSSSSSSSSPFASTVRSTVEETVTEIAEMYKWIFKQEAVLWIRSTGTNGGSILLRPKKRGDPMKVVQLSDMHVLAAMGSTLPSGVPPGVTFEKVIAYAKEVDPDPDVILLTGDYTHDNLAVSYRRVANAILAAWPRAQSKKQTERSDVCGPRVFFVPGNHEDLSVLKEVFVDEFGFEGSTHPETPVLLRVGRWDFLLLTSFVEGTIIGTIRQEAIDWIGATLRDGEEQRPAVVVMHHPPVSPPPQTSANEWTKICLTNGEAVADAIWRHRRVRAVLHGHVHADVATRPLGVDEAMKQGKEMSGSTAWQLCCPSMCVQFDTIVGGRHELLPRVGPDTSRAGYRTVLLRDDGRVDTSVHWIEVPRAKAKL